MKMTRISLALCVAMSALGHSHAIAAAFNLNEHSASGLGRAFAGEGAVADNASVLARNPAAMSKTAECWVTQLARLTQPAGLASVHCLRPA